ncbi:hypothetical protein D172_007945 [Pseudoalteromonas sp. Bsw20308]|nr:hypothetical protein D172_007945 [Pseudoalteromonas sp. Bsw20308]
MRKGVQLIKKFVKYLGYINTNYDRVSPFPFMLWFSISLCVWAFSKLGFSFEFIFANATYLNVIYGTVICTSIMLVSCILLPWQKVTDKYYKSAHAVSKIFSDTAMGSAGFIAVAGLYNGNYLPVGLLVLGLVIYVLVGNHVFHSIFNENIGTRRFFKEIDKKSNTRIGTGEIERNIETKVLAFTSFIILMVGSGLMYVFNTVYA